LNPNSNCNIYNLSGTEFLPTSFEESTNFQDIITDLGRPNKIASADLSPAIINAAQTIKDVDAFVIISNLTANVVRDQPVKHATDGMEAKDMKKVNPYEAFQYYRNKVNKPNCKFVYNSLISCSEPVIQFGNNDPNVLDIYGMPVESFRIISNFLNDIF
jgi:hypothetical protein